MYTDSINCTHKIVVEKLEPKLQGKKPEDQQEGNFDSKIVVKPGVNYLFEKLKPKSKFKYALRFSYLFETSMRKHEKFYYLTLVLQNKKLVIESRLYNSHE